MYNLILLARAGDSVLSKVVAEIPHSPAAIVLYLVLAACGIVIWRAHRSEQSPKE